MHENGKSGIKNWDNILYTLDSVDHTSNLTSVLRNACGASKRKVRQKEDGQSDP